MKCVVKNNSSMDMGPLLPLLKSLLPYSRKKLGFNRPPSLFFASDTENASKPLGKTAFYDPGAASITIFVDGRHPKDILRSISHELVHHMQHERGDFGTDMDTGEGYAQKNDALRELEREAYESGNMCFRDWEDENRQALQEAKKHFDRKNKKMSAKQKRNDKIESLLMEKWGFKAQVPDRKLLKEQQPQYYSVSTEPLTDEEKSKLTSIEDLEAAGVQLPVIGDRDGTNREMVTIDAEFADDEAAAIAIVQARHDARLAAAEAEAKRLEAAMKQADVEIDPYYGKEPKIEVEPVIMSVDDMNSEAGERFPDLEALNSGLNDLNGGKIKHNTRDSKILARALILASRADDAKSSGALDLLGDVTRSSDDNMRQFLISGIDSSEMAPIVWSGPDSPTNALKTSWVLNARGDDGNYYINSVEDIIAIMSGKVTDNIRGLQKRIEKTTDSANNLQDRMMLRYNLTTRDVHGDHTGNVHEREYRRESRKKKAEVKREIDELRDKIGADYTFEDFEADEKKLVDAFMADIPREKRHNASGAEVLDVPGVGFWGGVWNLITGVDQERISNISEDPSGTKRVAHELIELEAEKIESYLKFNRDPSIRRLKVHENIDRAVITKEFNKIVEEEKRAELDNAAEINTMLQNGYLRNRLSSRSGGIIFRHGRVQEAGSGEDIFEEVLSLDGFAEVLLPPGLDAESMKVFRGLRADFINKWDGGEFQSLEDIKAWAHFELGQPQTGEDGITRDWRGIDVNRDNYKDRVASFDAMGLVSVGRKSNGHPRHPLYLGKSYREGDNVWQTGRVTGPAGVRMMDPKESKRQQYFELKKKNIERVVKLAVERVVAKQKKLAQAKRKRERGRREDDIREALIRKVVQEALKRKFGE